jgi:hypothetical protein
MIIGAHTIIYSQNAEADRVFLRDILKLSNIDIGEGWLIFDLPAAELAVHPSEKNSIHELYFMCADILTFVATMKKQSIPCSSIQALNWGQLTQVTLPGGGQLGVYQPRHARPKAAQAPISTKIRTGRKQRAA